MRLNSRRTLAAVAAAILLLVVAGAVAVYAVRQNASMAAVQQIDNRLWFLRLKLRGEVPHIGWLEALRRLGPEWSRRNRYDLARAVGNGTEPCPVLWETPLGRFWGAEADGREFDLLSLEQAGGDIYEQRNVVVHDSDVVFDVGAHLGVFTRLALRRGARLVVAIEPNPMNTACLERTFASEIAAGRVRLVKAAAWHTVGSLNFEFGPSSQMGHAAARRGVRTLAVRATTLDAIAAEERLERVDFIKMDIEGAERHALAGARRILAEHKPRMAICIYHAPDDPQIVPQVVRSGNDSYQTFTRGGFQAYFY